MSRLVWVSPLFLLLLTWGVVGTVAAIVITDAESYPLTHFFVWKHHLDMSAFNWAAGTGLMLLVMAFIVGYLATGFALSRPDTRMSFQFDIDTAAETIWRVNLLFLLVTAFWFALTAIELGGPTEFLQLVRRDAYEAREILLENKLFTGMRLFYAALPATGCLAAGLLSINQTTVMSEHARRLCVAIVLINLIVLVILPLVLSQRLILLQYVFSIYITACIVRGRLVKIILVPIAIATFMLTWTIHEGLTNPAIKGSVNDIAAAKLSFYMVNDLWNSFRPMTENITHTWGLFTFQFALFFSLSDAFFYDMFAHQLAAVSPFRGGGEFSMFSASYVDFGLFGATIYLLILGGIIRYIFHRAQNSMLWAAIYGQCAVALILSVHVNFFASQDFIFSILTIVGILSWTQTQPKVRYTLYA